MINLIGSSPLDNHKSISDEGDEPLINKSLASSPSPSRHQGHVVVGRFFTGPGDVGAVLLSTALRQLYKA